VAISQFSDDARTEFKLNSYSNKERLLDAINKISYKGGNTKTGEFSSHTAGGLLIRDVFCEMNHRGKNVKLLRLLQIKSNFSAGERTWK